MQHKPLPECHCVDAGVRKVIEQWVCECNPVWQNEDRRSLQIFLHTTRTITKYLHDNYDHRPLVHLICTQAKLPNEANARFQII